MIIEQIKTVRVPYDEEEFDATVNAYLMDGWIKDGPVYITTLGCPTINGRAPYMVYTAVLVKQA